MPIAVGTDEAGYGPNLGPLVISATVWRAPESALKAGLYASLPGMNTSLQDAAGEPDALVFGDSKRLYKPGGGLAVLERGVLAALDTAQDGWPDAGPPSTWRGVLERCDPRCRGLLEDLPWYRSYDAAVPVDATVSEVAGVQRRLRAALAQAGIELVSIRSRIIFPAPFNERVRLCSKGDALSLWTFELIRELIEPLPDEPLLIQCDKHGARNRYAPLWQHVFPDDLVEVRRESATESVYGWGPRSRRAEVRFTVDGERYLPVAAASMTSKYLRELAMRAFNAFWCARVPNLRPTAGYPVDARRFRGEIRDVQRSLDIPDDSLWRMR